jgi:hypothetical protein
MISSFTDHTNVLQWALFDNTADYFCSTSMDLSIRCYNFDSVNNVFVSMRTWSVSSRIAAGDPYCMNFGIPNHIIVTVGPTIVFFDMTATPDPNPVLSYTDP